MMGRSVYLGFALSLLFWATFEMKPTLLIERGVQLTARMALLVFAVYWAICLIPGGK